MTRILIGNDFSEDVRDDRGWTGWWVQRLLWFAQNGDILVLPSAPEDAYLRYVTGLTGTDPASLRFVTPPAGSQVSLTPERLSDPVLVTGLAEALAGRGANEVLALWPDAAVCRLARSLSVAAAVPGYGFVDQGGGVLVNSKSFFRTIAAGAGVPIPPGAVCTSRRVAETAVMDLIDLGHPVIVKHDYLSGGRGNEILSAEAGIRPVGARRTVRIAGRADVSDYFDERWDWLSGGGRGRPVVEAYHRDSSAYFAEYQVTDEGVSPGGDGELLSAPFAVGQIMPCVGLEPEAFRSLADGAATLAEAVRSIGYRGLLCSDAVVTPEREVFFTEFNGRVTGSTHIYDRIGRHVVGPGYGADRIILERVWPEGWSVASFADMVGRLDAAGLGYDPQDRLGVVLTNAFDGSNGVMYCIVAEDIDRAWFRDGQLKALFADT